MDIHTLIYRNRLPRKQKGEIIETRTTFFARYYHTAEDGTRKQKAVKLCDKSDLYRSRVDVQPLMDRVMESVNAREGREIVTGQQSISDFVEKQYFHWCVGSKSAPTRYSVTDASYADFASRRWAAIPRQTAGIGCAIELAANVALPVSGATCS